MGHDYAIRPERRRSPPLKRADALRAAANPAIMLGVIIALR
jgi:hypothetical protein